MTTNRIHAMLRAGLGLLAALVLLISAPGCTQQPQPALSFDIDHFKIYEVRPVETQFEVGLNDQFADATKQARLPAISHFANPVEKRHGGTVTPIENRHAHLTFYRLDQPQPEPRRTVRYRNQFGQHSVDITDAMFLLVPTQKTSDPDSQPPRRLDHFKCYRVVRVNVEPALPVVDLRDQFGGQSGAAVTSPEFFCNPVRKIRPNGEVTRITNARDHLAIYPITPQPIQREIRFRNQFQEGGLQIPRAVWLAVPTDKQAFSPQG